MIIHKDYKLRLIVDPEIENASIFPSNPCRYAWDKTIVKLIHSSGSIIEIDMDIDRFLKLSNRALRKKQLIYVFHNINNKPISHPDNQNLGIYPLSFRVRGELYRRHSLL